MLNILHRSPHLLTQKSFSALSKISIIRPFSKRIHKNFSFPKHSSLFNEQYLEDHNEGLFPENPEEDLGVMRTYKSPRNLDPSDRPILSANQIMEKDLNQVRSKLSSKLAQTYSGPISTDSQQIENTQNLIARLKSKKDMQSVGEDFKRKRLQNEYLNYGKYQKNYISREDQYNPEDSGRETLNVKNYRDAMRRLNIKNTKDIEEDDRDIIKSSMTLNEDGNVDFGKVNDSLNSKWLYDYQGANFMRNFDLAQDLQLTDKQFLKEMNEAETNINFPRMSPWGKHRVYKDYKKGMNIRDISLKYGILPERACAIIWQKEYFFKVVYPKCGETPFRLGLNMELEYGEKYGFQDYGIDIQALAMHEQGVPCVVLGRTSAEKTPKKEKKKEIEKALGSMPGRRVFEVPIKHVGKGPRGYLLMELIWRRGKNSVKPAPGLIENVRRANKIRNMGY
jgi:hypothetical protein